MTDRWTDDELDDDFEAAMLGVEPGEPGPGMAESDRLVRASNENYRPSFFAWQLTKDRKRRIDSLTNKIVDLPPLPHGEFCRCGFCRDVEIF